MLSIFNQFLLIFINFYQFLSIFINFHQFLSISINFINFDPNLEGFYQLLFPSHLSHLTSSHLTLSDESGPSFGKSHQLILLLSFVFEDKSVGEFWREFNLTWV